MPYNETMDAKTALLRAALAMPGTNLASGLYARPRVVPGTNVIFDAPQDAGVQGEVDATHPFLASLSDSSQTTFQPGGNYRQVGSPQDVIIHELTHTGQLNHPGFIPPHNMANQRNLDNKNRLSASIQGNANNYASNAAYNPMELGANLVSTEARLPAGQTWLHNTPAGLAYLKAGGDPEYIYQMQHGSGIGGYITDQEVQRNTNFGAEMAFRINQLKRMLSGYR